jgi:PAS domain S-box-containing protein
VKRLKPIQKFALLSGVCIAGLCLALALFIHSLLEHQVRRVEWLSTAEIAKYQVEEHNLFPYFTDLQLRREPARYREAFQSLLNLPEVVRIKIWDREATVIWSDDERLIGRRFPENREVRQALAGQVSTLLKTLHKTEHEYERDRFTQLAEVYVPIRSKPTGEVIGILEVYKLPARLFADIERMQVIVWAIVMSGGILLYLGLLPIVRRSYREQIASEEALREMNVALTNAMPGISRLDPEGRYVHVNEVYAGMLGYEPSELIGTEWKPSVHPDDRENAIAAYNRILSEDKAEFEARAVCKDGSVFYKHVLMVKILDDDGNFVGHHCFMRDITERKRAEAALQAAKEYAATLINSSLNMIISVDANRKIVEFNRAAEEAFGYNKAEVLGQPVDLLYADPSEGSLVSGALLKHGRFSGEIGNRRKNGETFYSYLSASVVRDGNGNIVGGMGISWDITERKRAEEIRKGLYRASLEIQEPLRLKDRLDRLLQTAKDVLNLDRVNILLADPEGRLLQAVDSLGTEEPLEEIRVPIGPEGGAIAQAYLTKQAIFWDGRSSVPEELRLKSPYDQIEAFRSRVFANVPLIVQGKAIGVLGADRKHSRRPFEPAMRELLQLFASQAALAIEHARFYESLEAQVQERTRELRAANLELERASRFKSEFLANMSHELRTPLNSILGFAELLEDQNFGPLNEKQLRYVHNVWTSGRHLLDLINDILDLSKVEAGRMEIAPQCFALTEVLSAVLAMVRLAATRKQMSLTCEIAPQVTTITADPVRFKQIMYNLLSNAIKFTNGGGRVTVAARVVDGAFVEIAVTDTGIGIRAEDLPKLFQEFTQIDSFLGKQHVGTGLGLALTKRLVELHGGKIWAESLGPGQGTTFTFTLPIAASTSSVTG